MKEKTQERGGGRETVQMVRDYITLALPLGEAIARRTSSKLDDLGVLVLRVVAENDDVAQAVAAAVDELAQREGIDVSGV